MAHSSSPIIFLPGTGGELPNFSGFNVGGGDRFVFEALSYPGWQRYASKGFTVDALIGDLEAQIVTKIPEGPIRIVGYSVGGHFGYAAALHLQIAGREIAGFCAIDSFMIGSLAPSAEWVTRTLTEAILILREGRLGELHRWIRSKFWRGLFRLAGSRLPSLVQSFPPRLLTSLCAFDSILEKELNLRLLIQAVSRWTASLDREPVALNAPTSLLRTRLTASDDTAWERRCPSIEIFEIPGQHQTLLQADDIGPIRDAFLTATRCWFEK